MLNNQRTTTWRTFGTNVQDCTSKDDVLRKAKLDYTVSLEPIHVMTGDGSYKAVDGRFATTRSNDAHVYEVVSDRYQIIQNTDAFDFVDYFGAMTDLKWVSAGETPSGIVYMIAALPTMQVLDDDFTPFLIFQNSFNKRGGIKTSICPLRVVCQNQFNYAFKHSKGTVNIKHVGYVEGKLLEARNAYTYAIEHMHTLQETAERMSIVTLTQHHKERLLDTLFPLNDDSRSGFARDHARRKREAFEVCLNEADNGNYAGTAYGFLNAYSDYATHVITSNRASDDASAAFTRTCLKDGSMNEALLAIEDICGVGA